MTLREWVNRVWGTFRGHRADRDLEEELRLHLELAVDDARRRGEPRESAARAARLRAGGVAQAMEAQRDQRGLPWLEDLARDLRYACRMLARNPGFAIVSVTSLAIGIGANCAVFSFADTLLLRPLTVPRPGDVVTVGLTGSSRDSLVASYRDYLDIRNQSKSFSGLVAFAKATVGFATERGATPKLCVGMLVSGSFFRVVGVEPQLGRDFRPDEELVPGRDAVVILGHDFWEQQFGADPAILGRAVRLNGIEFTVVGVAPAGFTGLDQYVRFQFYAPIMMWPRLIENPGVRPLEARDFRSLGIAGRLKTGVTISQAQTELSVLATNLERAYPDANRNRRIAVRTELRNRIAHAPQVATLLAMLTMLAGAVLVVACANVAGLLTSRAPTRAREIALRLAIGAGRRRVIRQLITESGLVAMIGGVLGLGLGEAAVRLFSRIQIPTDLPIVAAFELDRRALLFSLVVALASAAVCGLAPAIRSTRTDLTAVMKATDAAGFGHRRRWGRAVLVGGQVAISVVLLAVATFVYRGFQLQLGNGPGFRTDHLLMMDVAPGQIRYSEAQAQQFFERLAESARLVPGVRSAGLTRYMPMDGLPPPVTIVPEGFQFPAGKESATHASSIVDEHYLDTIGLPILKGRGFRATDSADAPRVAVVNDVLARRYWPGIDPIGKRFRVDSSRGPWVEIVGVAKASKYGFVIEPPTEFVYFPFRQRPAESMFLLVESVGDPSDLATPLRGLVRSLDADLPISNVRTMEELYRMRSIIVLDVVVTIIGAMGTMGLALAIVGLYGLVAYAASRRTKEIGIRMAIGAQPSDVLRMVLRQGAGLAHAGLGLGLLASAGAARALAGIFPGGPGGSGGTDVPAFLLVAATVLVVTLVAAYIPARRASRVNPTEALRYE
jgi:macrolide transport system ATP-binding/permease protein